MSQRFGSGLAGNPRVFQHIGYGIEEGDNVALDPGVQLVRASDGYVKFVAAIVRDQCQAEQRPAKPIIFRVEEIAHPGPGPSVVAGWRQGAILAIFALVDPFRLGLALSLAGALLLLAELATALLIGFGPAGRRGIYARRHGLYGQSGDINGRTGDGSDNACGE